MLFVGVDVGSTAVKAAVVQGDGCVQALEAVEYASFSTRSGWIEQDPGELWRAVCAAITAAVRTLGKRKTDIRALALSVQRGTVIPVDPAGRAIYRAVSWQDLRAAAEWTWLGQQLEESFERITGLYPSPFWTVTKLAWLARREPVVWRTAHQFLLVHGYLTRQFGMDTAVEDPTSASFSGLLDLTTRQWSDTILGVLGLELRRLGVLRAPGSVLGEISHTASSNTGLPPGTLLVCGAGDQQAAALGAGAVVPGSVVISIGTAGVVLACTPHRPTGTGTPIACLAHAIDPLFQIEGMLGSAGSVLRWLASLTKSSTGFRYGGSIEREVYLQIDAEAASVSPGSEGLFVIPHFSVAQVPGDAPPGVIAGLSLSHGRAAIARAIMEGIAFEVRRLLRALARVGLPVRNLILCGGAAKSPVWNQIQADVYGQPITTPTCPHAAAVGAAMLAATGAGCHETLPAAVRHMFKTGATFEPGPRAPLYDDLFRRYEHLRLLLASGTDVHRG